MTPTERRILAAARRLVRAWYKWDDYWKDNEGHGGSPGEWLADEIKAAERNLQTAIAKHDAAARKKRRKRK